MIKDLNISKETKALFYDYICQYESSIKSCFGSYHLEDTNLQTFMRKKDLFIVSDSHNNRKICNNKQQYILFDNGKPKVRKLKELPNDTVHNLLRHIRNSMAHGNMYKKSKNGQFFIMEDYNRNERKTMNGKIFISTLEPLLNLLITTKR